MLYILLVHQACCLVKNVRKHLNEHLQNCCVELRGRKKKQMLCLGRDEAKSCLGKQRLKFCAPQLLPSACTVVQTAVNQGLALAPEPSRPEFIRAGPWQKSEGGHDRPGSGRQHSTTSSEGPRRGGERMDPAPVGAAPGPAAPMGGRGAAAAAHVALPRWRPVRTELPGRLRG